MTPHAQEKRRARRIQLIPLLVSSAGVAAVGVGTARGVQAANMQRPNDCSGSRCSKALEDAKERERQAALTTIGVGLGVAALGVAGYWFFCDRTTKKEKRRPRRFKAIPMIGQGGGAFRVEAKF